MLDPHLLETDLERVVRGCLLRGVDLDVQLLLKVRGQEKALLKEIEQARNERNHGAKEVPRLRKEGKDPTSLIEKMKSLGLSLSSLEAKHKEIVQSWQKVWHQIPNLPSDETPEGQSEEDNVEIKRWGILPEFDFEPKDHVDVAVQIGMDLDAAKRTHGSRFTVLRGELATLHRAISQLMLQQNLEAGFEECSVPVLVREEALFGTAQLPKFEDDLYRLDGGENVCYLASTSEVMLTNLVASQIIPKEELPLKFTAQTSCFRRESGSYGRDVRGMIRNHQFEKVELVAITSPEQAENMLETMVTQAESILELLGLPYRRMLLCSKDMGFAAAKTYDLEVYLPSSKAYREISSCSWCTDFQARRMNTRTRAKNQKSTEWVHTLNGSSLAVGRTLVAILDNYQQEDGSLLIPEALRPYMRGQTHIRPKS